MSFIQHELPARWTVELASVPDGVDVPEQVLNAGAISATVPGCVHTDLLDHGLIPDPYVADHEPLTHWIGRCDWRYRTTLTLDAALISEDRVELIFDGLDTLATIKLNGRVVGESKNMHVRQRFDIKAVAREGDNDLEIRFDSARAYIDAMDAELGPRPKVGHGSNAAMSHNMIRKMACNFGWDWGPQLITCGVWRPGRVEAWSGARLGDVRPLVRRADTEAAELEVRVDVDLVEGSAPRLDCTLEDPAGTPVAKVSALATTGEASMLLRVDQPQLWWPVDYGQQPRYRLRVALNHDGTTRPQTATCLVGLRTVELCTDADDKPIQQPVAELGQGESFYLQINGQRVFCKGANWIPDDCFPHRVTPQRYRQRIDQALEANMNMLRVWGGGIYEDHAFYDYCDERGMLVWQDFLLACACYPEEEPIAALIEEEAEDNVSRLCRHPSLVLWNGCNENIWGTFDWTEDWIAIRERGEQTWGLGYYLERFPRILERIDPSRPYWPGSPYSGAMSVHPNANTHGNRHIWDVWNGHGDYRNYLGHYPRFASEFGFQGPPAWPTLCRAIPEEHRAWLSPVMHMHNKQRLGQQRALDRIADDCDGYETGEADFEDTWFLASVQQCRALTLGCEWFRALSPWCSGALYWQLNDCWPVTSWSAIDGDGRPKLLWHATRRFFRDRLITLMPAGITPAQTDAGPLAVYLHNDHGEAWSGRGRVLKLRIDGQTLADRDFDFAVAARESWKLELEPSWAGKPGELLVAQVLDDRGEVADQAFWFFGRDRDIPYERPTLKVDLEPMNDGLVLQVTANTVVRDLCLLADRVAEDAEVQGQFVTLLPGQTTRFVIQTNSPLAADSLTAPRVLRSVNTLARRLIK
ncbi:MAG: sugar-binding domain-containing protein [Planctomycetota bacterium]